MPITTITITIIIIVKIIPKMLALQVHFENDSQSRMILIASDQERNFLNVKGDSKESQIRH